MSIVSPVSERLNVVALLLLTFATGMSDAISILAFGHVFVANMTGNIVFLGFWLARASNVDLTGVAIALPAFVAATVLGGRLVRHLGERPRQWLTAALGLEIVLLVMLSILAG